MNNETKPRFWLMFWSSCVGATLAILFLMAIGETGGSTIRAMRAEDAAAYAEYRSQCEAVLNRAVGAMERDLEAHRGRG